MADTFYYNHPDDNVAPDATPTVETGTAEDDYEAQYLTDLSDEHYQRPARLQETSGAWLLDFGAPQRVDLVAVWHNFDEALGNVKIQGNATNSWGGPSLSYTFTVPAKRPDGGTIKLFKNLTGVTGYSTTGFRYWRLVVGNANSVPIGAKIWLGELIRQLSVDVTWSVVRSDRRPIIVLPTDTDPIAWSYDLGVNSRLQAGRLAAVSDTDRELVRNWLDAGAAGISLVVPEPDDDDMGAWLTRFVPSGDDGLVKAQLETEWYFRDINNLDLRFQEITAGGPEWV